MYSSIKRLLILQQFILLFHIMKLLIQILKLFQYLIKNINYIIGWIIWSLLFILIIYVEPWNIWKLADKFSLEYKKTTIYNKTDRETFKKEVFWSDQTLLNNLKSHLFDNESEYKIEQLEWFKIWESKKIKTKEWIVRDNDWKELKEWEEYITEKLNIENLFTVNDFIYFLKSIWFKWSQFHSIFDEILFKDSDFIKLYESILEDINNMYKVYYVHNEKKNVYYIFLMIKTEWELIDEWYNINTLYSKIQDLNSQFYSKIWTLISEKYREISALAPHDLWMLQLVKYKENFSKLINDRKKTKQWLHNIMIFNFYWKYSNFWEYAKNFIWSERFLNDYLFKKLVNIE